jgi:hypothetical protein
MRSLQDAERAADAASEALAQEFSAGTGCCCSLGTEAAGRIKVDDFCKQYVAQRKVSYTRTSPLTDRCSTSATPS